MIPDLIWKIWVVGAVIICSGLMCIWWPPHSHKKIGKGLIKIGLFVILVGIIKMIS